MERNANPNTFFFYVTGGIFLYPYRIGARSYVDLVSFWYFYVDCESEASTARESTACGAGRNSGNQDGLGGDESGIGGRRPEQDLGRSL